MVIAACILFSIPSFADNISDLEIRVDFENVDGLTIASWTIKNVSKLPIRPGTMIADYACADGFIERVEHIFRVTISPDTSYKDEGSFVCAGREKALSYSIIGNNEDTTTPVAGNEVFYQVLCGDGTKVFVIMKWNRKGYYDYETANNFRGILTKDAVADDSFVRRACDPSLPPTESMFIGFKDWVIKQLLKRQGDPKKGYTKPAGGFVVRG